MVETTISQAKAAPRRSYMFAALLAGNVAIAFGPLLVRYASTGPVASGFWRLALAVPFLTFFAYRSGFRWRAVSGTTMAMMITAGLFFAADIAVWHIGLFQTKMGNATLFANCASLILVVYGVILARALPGWMQIIAVLLAILGSALLMGQSLELSPQHLVGDLLCLLGGILYAVYLVIMIRVRATTDSWGSLAIASTAAATGMLPVALILGEQIIPADWTPLLILAFSSQIFGQGCLTYALPHFSPLVIGLALLIQPVLSATTGWFAFGEVMTAQDIIGGVMVMGALILVRLSPDTR